MSTVTRGGLVLAAIVWALVPTHAAWADEATDARIERLERLLREQARQIEALRRAQGAPTPRQPAPAPAPAATPATAPAPAAAPAAAAPPAAAPAPTPADHPVDFLGERGRLTRGGPGTLRWGGYATLEYRDSTQSNSFFDLHRLILTFDAEVSKCVDVSMELEIEHGGIGGGNRDGDVKLEHFTIAWHHSDFWNVKLGAPLVPFGRYNLFHDDPLNDFTLRPWVARYMVPTGFGQPGIGLFGSCPVGCGSISYDVLLSNGFSDGFTDSGGVRDGRQSWKRDNNDSKQLWGRVHYAQSGGYFDYLEAGVSGTWGRYDDEDRNDLWGYAVDLLLRKGSWELQGEYYRYDIERDAFDPATAVRGMDAWYLQLAYHFFPCSLRKCDNCMRTPTSHFTLAARYQSMDLDDRVTGASFNDDLESLTLGLNYRLTEGTVFRFDWSWLWPENDDDEREWSLSVSTYF